MCPEPPTPNADRGASAAFMRFTSTLAMVATVLIREPNAPDVSQISPGEWRDLDQLVAEHGTRFTRWGREFDIGSAVSGQLGRGKVALLVLADPSTPRLPSPEEAAVLRISESS